jgi:hypothetical protein
MVAKVVRRPPMQNYHMREGEGACGGRRSGEVGSRGK